MNLDSQENRELPPGWIETTLSEVASMRLGKMLDAAKQGIEKPLPYLRNINVRWGEFDLTDLLTMTFDKPEVSEFELRPGDVLVCEGGEPGRAAVWDRPGTDIKFQKALHRIRFFGGIDPRWLIHQLHYDALQGTLADYFSGTTIKHFTGVALSRYRIKLPPPSEQRRIVAKIEALQARSRKAREALKEVPALLEQFRQSVLGAVFRGDLTADWRESHPDAEPATVLLDRIRQERRRRWESAELARMKSPPRDDRWKAKYHDPEPVEDSELPELPEGWCWTTMDFLTPAESPIVYGIILPGPHIEGGVPFIRPVDIKDGRVDLGSLPRTTNEIAEKYSRSALLTGDLIYSIVGTIGKWFVVPPSLEGANITQSSVRLRPLPPLDVNFFVHVLQSPQLSEQMTRLSFGNAVQRLNVGHVRRLAVPVPPLAEWQALGPRIRLAMNTVTQIEAHAADASFELRNLEQAILAKAFRGELAPQDPNDEPASVLLERIGAARSSPNGKAPKRPRQQRLTGLD